MEQMGWRPWSDRSTDQVWRDFDRLFGAVLGSLGAMAPLGLPGPAGAGAGAGFGQGGPRVELFEDGPALVVRAELPGLEAKDVDLRIADDALTVRAEQKAELEERREGYYHTERHCGTFLRTIPFPMLVDATSARATFRSGLLEVRAMKRSPEVGPGGRRLQIEG